MNRISRIDNVNRLSTEQKEKNKYKLIFTRIIFVSEEPRIIRIMRIEKEVELR